MVRVSPEEFLKILETLFKSSKNRSLQICMKRYDNREKRNPRKPNDRPKRGSKTPVCQAGDLMPSEYKCLIRARLGDRKISAAIGQKDMNKFQLSYSNLIKTNIYCIKKQTNKSR